MAMAKHQCIRVPPDVKRWLEQEAARNLSSQSSEIIRSIRMRMEAEKRESRRTSAASNKG
jgi:hypothetical protein